MGKELTDRQAELLRDVRLLSERHKELKAEEDRLSGLLQSAIRAAAVEGVRQRQIAVSIEATDSWVSQVTKNPKVQPWWVPARDGELSPRDQWHTWLTEHQNPDPPQ